MSHITADSVLERKSGGQVTCKAEFIVSATLSRWTRGGQTSGRTMLLERVILFKGINLGLCRFYHFEAFDSD